MRMIVAVYSKVGSSTKAFIFFIVLHIYLLEAEQPASNEDAGEG